MSADLESSLAATGAELRTKHIDTLEILDERDQQIQALHEQLTQLHDVVRSQRQTARSNEADEDWKSKYESLSVSMIKDQQKIAQLTEALDETRNLLFNARSAAVVSSSNLDNQSSSNQSANEARIQALTEQLSQSQAVALMREQQINQLEGDLRRTRDELKQLEIMIQQQDFSHHPAEQADDNDEEDAHHSVEPSPFESPDQSALSARDEPPEQPLQHVEEQKEEFQEVVVSSAPHGDDLASTVVTPLTQTLVQPLNNQSISQQSEQTHHHHAVKASDLYRQINVLKAKVRDLTEELSYFKRSDQSHQPGHLNVVTLPAPTNQPITKQSINQSVNKQAALANQMKLNSRLQAELEKAHQHIQTLQSTIEHKDRSLATLTANINSRSGSQSNNQSSQSGRLPRLNIGSRLNSPVAAINQSTVNQLNNQSVNQSNRSCPIITQLKSEVAQLQADKDHLVRQLARLDRIQQDRLHQSIIVPESLKALLN